MQVSLLPALRPFGVVPNVALVTLVLVGLYMPTSEVLVAATAAGLILDLAGGANFGLWTGVLLLVALAIGMLHRAGIELEAAYVAPVLVAAGTLVIALVIWLGVTARTAHFAGFDWIGRLLIELVINLVLTMMLRPLVRLTLVGRGRQNESGGVI
jgi:hypothetical protein